MERMAKPSRVKLMRALRESCVEAGVSVHPEVEAFFKEFPERPGQYVNLVGELRLVPHEVHDDGKHVTIYIDRNDLEDSSGRLNLISVTFERGVFDQVE